MTKKMTGKTQFLRLSDVPDPVGIASDTAVVEIPSFGDFQVTVRPLSVFENNLLLKRRFTLFIPANAEQGENGARKRPEPQFTLRDDFDEACLVAAWCSLDPDGNLAFGVDKSDAEERVRSLPSRHVEDIKAIHKKVAELSNLERTEFGETEEAAIEDAEKN